MPASSGAGKLWKTSSGVTFNRFEASMWQVIGQGKAVSLLRSGLAQGSLSHAYLFTGPPHVGKMTLATHLAQALNCESSGAPCGQCRSCEKIASGNHADVQVVAVGGGRDGEKAHKEIGIDRIREMQHQAHLPPFEGRHKVFIIDGAEALSPEASNSLLKTLEEPVGRILFILLSTDEKLLPETVVSRCQHLKLAPVSVKEVETYLRERMSVPAEEVKLISHLSRGLPGWAIGASQDEGLLQERTDMAEELLGLIDADYENRFTFAAELARDFARDSSSVKDVFELMLEIWRDILLSKVGCKENIVNINLESELTGLASYLSLEQIRDFIEGIQAAEVGLSQNASPRLVFEVLMLNMPRRERVVI
jgi:DNA polymerase-3 subunit delta'